MYRCRTIGLALLFTALSLSVRAANEEDSRNPNNPLDQGGDVCATATVIPSLPYCDTGTTVGYANNYTPPCATNGNAPDVVYVYTPNVTQVVTFSLCGSSYNTAIHIWRNCPPSGELICCNDNFCGPQSCCSGVTLIPGSNYYIIVDGGIGGVTSGSYLLNVVPGADCPSQPCSPPDTCLFPRSRL